MLLRTLIDQLLLYPPPAGSAVIVDGAFRKALLEEYCKAHRTVVRPEDYPPGTPFFVLDYEIVS